MVKMDSQTGSAPYYEPLHNKLVDAFTAKADVAPRATFSSSSTMHLKHSLMLLTIMRSQTQKNLGNKKLMMATVMLSWHLVKAKAKL